jgi:hypothetical protein
MQLLIEKPGLFTTVQDLGQGGGAAIRRRTLLSSIEITDLGP